MSEFTNPASRSPDLSRSYVDAVVTLVGDRNPLEILTSTGSILRRILHEAPEGALDASEGSGTWSVREVLRHLADSELVWAVRLRLVLAQERPTLSGYDQDAWAARLRYREADPAATLREFQAVREGNLGLLDGLAPEELRRVGVHAERGEESVALMVSLYAGHDLVHLRQMGRILRRVGWSLEGLEGGQASGKGEGDPRPGEGAEVQRVRTILRRAVHGGAWHGPSILELVEGLPAHQAGHRPIPGRHTTWELLLHLETWLDAVARRLHGEPVRPSPEANFPPQPPPNEEAWSAAIARFRAAHARLDRAVAGLGDRDLLRPSPAGGSSVYEMLLGSAEHLAYHGGQMALQRPPAADGGSQSRSPSGP